MPKGKTKSGPRNIITKFSLFKEHEKVRRSAGNLKGLKFVIFQQFPRLVPAILSVLFFFFVWVFFCGGFETLSKYHHIIK